jgi:PAS domain S-box-containing protein
MVEVLGTHAVRLMRSRVMNALKGVGSEQGRALFDGEGGLRHYRSTYTPVSIDDSVIGFATVLVDITEELNTQAALSRDSVGIAQLTERHRHMVAAGTEVLGRLRRALDQLQAAGSSDEPDARFRRLAQELRGCIGRLREGTLSLPEGSGDETRSTAPSSVEGWNLQGMLSSPSSTDAWTQPGMDDRIAGLEAEVFALLDQLPILVTEWDRTLSLRYANQAASEAFMDRWGVAKVTGLRLEQIVDEEFLRTHEPYAEGVLRGRAQSFHRRRIGPDGEERHFQVRYVPRIADGEVIGGFAYASEITERVRAAEELTAARSAYASLQERQVIEDRVHGSVLQELFAAAMLLDAAAGGGGDMMARVEESRLYVRMALDGLAQLS